MKIAAAQLSPIFLNKEQTVEKACEAILEAGSQGANLIVFPEVFISGYPDWVWLIPNSKGAELNELYLQLVKNAISAGDESTKKLSNAAKQAQIAVAIGVNEKSDERSGSNLFNSLFLFNPDGALVGQHRKIILTGGERLVWSQGDGQSLIAHEMGFAKIGGLICWENLVPLARTAMYESGAQVMVAPTWDKSPNWIQSMQHIAREGGTFVVSVCMALRMNDVADHYPFKNLYPEGREWINVGNSCIIAPNGKIIAGPVEAQETILYAEVDLSDVVVAKRMFDVAGHYSRPDIFEFKVRNPE